MSADQPHNLPSGSEHLLREAARRQGQIEADLQAAQDQPPAAGDLWVLPEPTEALLGEPPTEELLTAHDAADVEWLVVEANSGDPGDPGDPGAPKALTLLPVDLMPLATSRDLSLDAEDGGPMVLRGSRSYRVPVALLTAGARTGRLSPSGLQRVHLHLQNLRDEARITDPEDEEYELDPEYREWLDEVLHPAHHLVTTLASKLSQRTLDSGSTPGDSGSSSSVADETSTEAPPPSLTPPSSISRHRSGLAQSEPRESGLRKSTPGEQEDGQSTSWSSRPSLLAAALILGLAAGYLFSAQQYRQQLTQLSSELAEQRATSFDVAGTVTLEPGIEVRSETFQLIAGPEQTRQITVIVSTMPGDHFGITVRDAVTGRVIAERRRVKINNEFSTTLRFSPEDLPEGIYTLELRHGVSKELLSEQRFVVASPQSEDPSPESPPSPP